MSEAIIRDLLADNLSVLEPGLELLDIEKYIPSTFGTRSFLDLLAKDRMGQWVIIEVKKTDAAAREAAHEVFKYAEAVMRHFGARSDEIRVVVASIEWRELLIPFSRLKSETTISVDGYRLELDAVAKTLKAELVETIAVNQGRYLAPWHELNMYHDQSSLTRGIKSFDKCCKAKNIEDYVMVILKLSATFNKGSAYAIDHMFQKLSSTIGSRPGYSSTLSGKYQYILYFAPQILSREHCIDIISHNKTKLEEIIAFTSGMSGDEELCTLHESAYDTMPRPVRDWLEIGYSAKFQDLLINELDCVVEQVLRRGAFARNSLLSDQAIIDELKGSTGSSGRSFKRTIDMSNRAHVAAAKSDLATALASNIGWLTQINRVLDDISKEAPEAAVEIDVLCPSSGVFSLYFIATDEDPILSAPQYDVLVKDKSGNINKIYLGVLAPNDQNATLNDILDKYYDGDIRNLMLLAGTGYFDARDVDIMDDLGLTYKTFRLNNPAERSGWFELKDGRWKEIFPDLPFQPLNPYFEKNQPLISSIVNAIGSRMHEGFHDLS